MSNLKLLPIGHCLIASCTRPATAVIYLDYPDIGKQSSWCTCATHEPLAVEIIQAGLREFRLEGATQLRVQHVLIG